MQVHNFALLSNNRNSHLFKRPLNKGFAGFPFKAYKGYIITSSRQRRAYAYHTLVVIEVVGYCADYSLRPAHVCSVLKSTSGKAI